MPINLEIFSPVQQLHNTIFDEARIQVDIKRDDLIHPLVSGNKWRKLKYVLQKAQTEGKRHLITFGGAYSNHLLATASAAAQFGFRAIAFVRGEEVQNSTLFLCKLHGMQLLFTSRESYRDKMALFHQFFGNDNDAFFIDEGGASPEAAQGCAELIGELAQTYDYIFCACGTGTTAAGLINGIHQTGLNAKFEGVPVFKNGGFLRNDINRFLTSPPAYNLHTGYHFGGYARTTPELMGFIQQFVAATGIVIEPLYTGKMLYALYELARSGYFKPDSRILAIHTGGVIGLLGMQHKF